MTLASTPPDCSTGTWAQQWNCGLHANQTGAHVSYGTVFAGHGTASVLAVVAGILIGLYLIAKVFGRRRPATSS